MCIDSKMYFTSLSFHLGWYGSCCCGWSVSTEVTLDPSELGILFAPVTASLALCSAWHSSGEGQLSWFWLENKHCGGRPWEGWSCVCPWVARSERVRVEMLHTRPMEGRRAECVCGRTRRAAEVGLGATATADYVLRTFGARKGQCLQNGDRERQHFQDNCEF